MNPSAHLFLEEAERQCVRARVMLGVDLYEDAGRAAYLAAFHAAQALIAERTARSMKTHRGVHSEFARLTRDDAFDSGLRTFLSRAYEFKSTADYDVGPDAFVPPEQQKA